MAKILITAVRIIGNSRFPQRWRKTAMELDKSEIEERRKNIIRLYRAKRCLFIYEER
jgi:hypothetical protein